jgi:hypothetical protein
VTDRRSPPCHAGTTLPQTLAVGRESARHGGGSWATNFFHPTSLVNFRQRLIEEGLEPLGFQSILDGLVEAGLVARQSRQRLDSTQIFGRISRMSRLECVRETLRLALEESRERFTHHEQVTAGNLQFLQGVVASRPLGFVER